MELSYRQTVKITALLLLLAAIIQPIYTYLYQYAPEVNRQFLWSFEGLLFVLLAAFAGSALVMAKRYTLGFSAIAFSAVLNVLQVGVGLTQFGPFREAATANADLGGVAFSVVAFSFFVYNAAKILLGFAALIFGMAKSADGSKAIGGLTALVGVVAMVSNTSVMILGREGLIPSPVAGASGVIATLLLAWCLLGVRKAD